MIVNLLKSKTFWGAVIFVITQFLEDKGIVSQNPASIFESVGIGLGLFGARNTKKKR